MATKISNTGLIYGIANESTRIYDPTNVKTINPPKHEFVEYITHTIEFCNTVL